MPTTTQCLNSENSDETSLLRVVVENNTGIDTSTPSGDHVQPPKETNITVKEEKETSPPRGVTSCLTSSGNQVQKGVTSSSNTTTSTDTSLNTNTNTNTTTTTAPTIPTAATTTPINSSQEPDDINNGMTREEERTAKLRELNRFFADEPEESPSKDALGKKKKSSSSSSSSSTTTTTSSSSSSGGTSSDESSSEEKTTGPNEQQASCPRWAKVAGGVGSVGALSTAVAHHMKWGPFKNWEKPSTILDSKISGSQDHVKKTVEEVFECLEKDVSKFVLGKYDPDHDPQQERLLAHLLFDYAVTHDSNGNDDFKPTAVNFTWGSRVGPSREWFEAGQVKNESEDHVNQVLIRFMIYAEHRGIATELMEKVLDCGVVDVKDTLAAYASDELHVNLQPCSLSIQDLVV